MKVIKSEFAGTDLTGKDWYRAIIVADATPDTLPTTGEGVDGMPDSAGIAAGSVLLTPDGNTVYYSDAFVDENFEGILSVTISPAMDFTPSLGTIFPYKYSDNEEDHYEFTTSNPFDVSETYEITVTPPPTWYALNYVLEEYGEQGEPVTFEVAPYNQLLSFVAATADDPGTLTRLSQVDIEIVYGG